MTVFDRHLMKEWLHILFLVLVAICGVLFIQICFDDFRPMIEAGARGREFWRYLLVTMPSFLGIVLPISILLSLLFTLTKFHRAGEITAMRSVGVSLFRMTVPIWIIGVIACGAVYLLNSTVVPWSVEQSRKLEMEMDFRREAKYLPPDRVGAVFDVAFDNARDGRMWFINRYSRSLGKAYGLSVSELDRNHRELVRIVAATGWYDPGKKAWHFQNGRLMNFDPDSGIVSSSQPFQNLVDNQFQEDPQLMLLTGDRPRDLSLFELKRLMDHFEADHNPKGVEYAVRYYSLIADTLGPLIVIAIAIPFAVTGVRVNPAVGVSKSIGLFFLYYIFATVAESLALKRVLEPDFTAWLPNLGMAGLAAWFLARMR